MEDTYIHLSIAFLDVKGKILEIHKMDPHNPDRRYFSRVPSRYALEVNHGWFIENNIKVGDRVEIDLKANPTIVPNITDQ